MRLRIRVALAATAFLIVAGTITAAVAAPLAGGASGDYSRYEGTQKERCENAQAEHRMERIRQHCADNPREPQCQRLHAAERHEAYCAKNPRDERCKA